MGKKIAPVWCPVKKRSLTVVIILGEGVSELHDIVFGHYDADDSPPNMSRVVSSGDVFLILSINPAPHCDSPALPARDKARSASSSRSWKKFMTPPKHTTTCCKTSTMWTRIDAVKAFSYYMKVFDLERDQE